MSTSKKLLLENIATNYAYVVTMGMVTLFATPVYVRHLGPEAWGMVALCMTLQGILLMLDLGLTQVMPREIATAGASLAGKVHAAFLRLYGIPALLAFLCGQIWAPELAKLLSPQLAQTDGFEMAVRLVLTQFLFQFTNNANLGYWNGLERQKRANLRSTSFALLKHGSALFLVLTNPPDIRLYMAPFAVVAVLEFFWNAISIKAEAQHTPAPSVHGPTLPELVKSATGFSLAVGIGMMTSQIDRIYSTQHLTVSDFGAYVLAANLALAMMQLQAPLQRAFAPRILAKGTDTRKNIKALLLLVGAINVLPCLIMASAPELILQWWLRSESIATLGAPVFRWMLVAVAMNSVYSVTYLLFLKNNSYLRVTLLNAFILALQAGYLWTWGVQHGIAAGAYAWLICGSVQFLVAVKSLRPAAYASGSANA